MMNHIILGVLIVLFAWLISSFAWLLLLNLVTMLLHPAEWLLNWRRIAEWVAESVAEDRFFQFCFWPLFHLYCFFEWLIRGRRDDV